MSIGFPCDHCFAVSQSNFGPRNNSATVSAWASPTANSSLVFPAGNCSVVVAHTVLSCMTFAAVGAALTWYVVVEGLSNALPQSSVSPPSVFDVYFIDPNVSRALTVGGTLVSISGVNFGPSMSVIGVTLRVLADLVPVTSCSMPEPDSLLECALPPGSGVISAFIVRVLDQSTSFAPKATLAYSVPMVRFVDPLVWPTDLSSLAVVVTGTSFGLRRQSQAVRVVISSPPLCGSVGEVVLEVPSIVVRSDTEMAFEVHDALPHAAPFWRLEVSVSEQRSERIAIQSRPPSISSFLFRSAPNATHYFLSVLGTDFGPAVSDCEMDVSVTIDGRTCEMLTMSVAHGELLCTTRAGSGNVRVTLGSRTATAWYDAREILQPPVVTSVSPLRWSTTASTAVTILGQGYVRCKDIQCTELHRHSTQAVTAADLFVVHFVAGLGRCHRL